MLYTVTAYTSSYNYIIRKNFYADSDLLAMNIYFEFKKEVEDSGRMPYIYIIDLYSFAHDQIICTNKYKFNPYTSLYEIYIPTKTIIKEKLKDTFRRHSIV